MAIKATPYPIRRPPARLEASLYSEPFRPYFVTVCCKAGRPRFKEASAAQRVADALRRVAQRTDARIGAYCVMPDHVHFLVWFERGRSLFSFVRSFKSAVTRDLKRQGLRQSPWQRSFYDHICRDNEDLHQVCSYILANPVRKGLCNAPTAWSWSALLDPLPTGSYVSRAG